MSKSLPHFNNRTTLLFCLLAVFVPHSLFAQSQQLDSTHIADDTFIVASLNIRHLRQYEKKNSELLKRIGELVKANTAMPFEKMDEMQFVIGGKKDGDTTNMFEVKFVFSGPVDIKPILKTAFPDLKPAEYNGKKYFRAEHRHSPSMYLNDENVLVMANQSRLLKLIDAEKADSHFAGKLQTADVEADFFLAFKRDGGFDEFTDELLEELPKLPFNLKDILTEATHGSLTVNLDQAQVATINLVAQDQEGAERLKRTGDAMIAFGRIGIPKCEPHAREYLEDVGAPANITKAVLDAIKKTAEVLDATSVVVDDKSVTAKAQLKGGLVSTIRDATKSLLYFVFHDEHDHHHHDHEHDHEHENKPDEVQKKSDIIELPFED